MGDGFPRTELLTSAGVKITQTGTSWASYIYGLTEYLPSALSPTLRKPQAGGQSQTPPTPRLTGSRPGQRKGQGRSPCGVGGRQVALAPPSSFCCVAQHWPNTGGRRGLGGQARQSPGIRCPGHKAPSAHQEQRASRGHCPAGLWTQ